MLQTFESAAYPSLANSKDLASPNPRICPLAHRGERAAFYGKNNTASGAKAAGTACTKSIRRLTVTAP